MLVLSSMAVAVKCKYLGKVTGRGWISLRWCSHTIGFYFESEPGYCMLDMSYVPTCEVRVVGAFGQRPLPDPFDLKGHGVPDVSLGIDGQYYYDIDAIEYNLTQQQYSSPYKVTYYLKSNGAWVQQSIAFNVGNTCMRVEANGNDYRLININMKVGLIFGYRGLEIICANGGWINSGTFTGGISDFAGNFITVGLS